MRPMLDREQRSELIASLRRRAASQPGLSAKQRREFRRAALNLERTSRYMDRKRAQRNEHLPHPTRQ